jgi:hypothetical protein
MSPSGVLTAPVCLRACRVVLLCCCVLIAGAWTTGCSEKNWRPASDAVYTVADLKALKGKTRDEVRERLGEPKGLYTIDAKGRWHYPHMKIEDTETRETYEATVLIYFSQLGEQRATIIEITKRTE